MKIHHRYTHSVIWEDDAPRLAASVQNALAEPANLRSANLRGADLWSANLWSANLEEANLEEANLRGANLWSANLVGANLRDAYLPSPPAVLSANWGDVSDDLCLELMRYDAWNHPSPESFLKWITTGKCPYDGIRVQRAAHFHEKPHLFSPGPSKSAYELMVLVLDEKCITERNLWKRQHRDVRNMLAETREP